jgi:hypothetical protein
MCARITIKGDGHQSIHVPLIQLWDILSTRGNKKITSVEPTKNGAHIVFRQQEMG